VVKTSKIAATVLTAGFVMALAAPALAAGGCNYGHKQSVSTSSTTAPQTATTATDKSDNGG